MAKYTDTVYQRSFSASKMKDAYLKACKWYASNVLSKDELNDIQVEYIKSNKKGQLPTVTVRLFVSLEEADVKAQHCAICRETHRHFYINDNTNCSWCKVDAFDKRMQQMLKHKKNYVKNKIERRLNG